MIYRLVLISFFCISTIMAQSGAKIGLSYLKIGVDARASAMGDAYTALAHDATAAYWNPAGLAQATSNSVVFMHNSWIQGINHDFAAVQLFHGVHNLAVSLNMMFVSGIELRGDQATEIPDGETSAHNVTLGLSYATDVGKDWKLGWQAKYLYEKYYLVSAAGLAFDFGVMKHDILPNMSWGAVIQNMGSMEKLKDEATKLPLSFRTGISYNLPWTIFGNNPLAAADIYHVKNDVTRLGLGLEAAVFEYLDIRAGYVFGSDSHNFTAGLGITYSRYNISYAFIPFQYDLGNSHQFSLAISFD